MSLGGIIFYSWKEYLELETFLFIVVIIVTLLAGFVVGIVVSALTEKSNGVIILEKNEQGDDRIRFCLNMEYDDISKHSKIVFSVKNNTQ